MLRRAPEAFWVSGPRARTNNALEFSGSGEIPKLWERFYAARTGPEGNIYGVYSDYNRERRLASTTSCADSRV